jgi:hypothetical protein
LQTNSFSHPWAPAIAALAAAHFTDEALQMNLWALGKYGRYSAGALTIISNYQNYRNDLVAVVAQNAKNKIREDMKAATKAAAP